MSTTDCTRNDKVFRFFDLPVELRNLVYTFALVKRPLPFDFHEDDKATYRVSGACGTQALLVSKRFHDEIKKEAYRHTMLTISSGEDGSLALSAVTTSEVRKSMERLQHLTLRLGIWFSDGKHEPFREIVSNAQHDLRELLCTTFPYVQTLCVQLELYYLDIEDIVERGQSPAQIARNTTRLHRLLVHSPLDIEKAAEGRQTALKTNHEVIVEVALFESRGALMEVADYLSDTGRNNVRYRATSSNASDAWFGMDLVVIEASGEVDLDAAVEEMKRSGWLSGNR